jgi:hypothetical protein
MIGGRETGRGLVEYGNGWRLKIALVEFGWLEHGSEVYGNRSTSTCANCTSHLRNIHCTNIYHFATLVP